jgi:hypothetical protein
MMIGLSSVLHDLYYGRISPWERRPARNGESRELGRKIADERRYFIQKLSPDDCQRFQELENLYTQFSDLEQADAFSYGFRLGLCLMAEGLTEDF